MNADNVVAVDYGLVGGGCFAAIVAEVGLVVVAVVFDTVGCADVADAGASAVVVVAGAGSDRDCLAETYEAEVVAVLVYTIGFDGYAGALDRVAGFDTLDMVVGSVGVQMWVLVGARRRL